MPFLRRKGVEYDQEVDMLTNEGARAANMKRTSVFLDADSHADIAAIKRANGLSSDSAAIRFALRRIARALDREQIQVLHGEGD